MRRLSEYHDIHTMEIADIEFWYARELMPLLGYERWENFDKAVCRAMESCEASGIIALDHFREVTKMMTIDKGGQRGIKPENLPPSEDIKKLERRVKSQEKKIVAQAGILPKDFKEGE